MSLPFPEGNRFSQRLFHQVNLSAKSFGVAF
jgi:hypothetical protein